MLTYDLHRVPDATHHCLVLHGLGDSMAGWKPVAAMLGIARLGWVFANAPQPHHQGWSWFDVSPAMAPDIGQIRRNRLLIAELIAHLETAHGIPAERLFVMGFSQGCVMTLDSGLRHDRRFAGLIALSGWLAMADEYPAAFGAAARDQDILMGHGLHDQLIGIHLIRAQAATMKALGLRLDWREYRIDHGVDPERELADIRAFITARQAAPGGRGMPAAT